MIAIVRNPIQTIELWAEFTSLEVSDFIRRLTNSVLGPENKK